MSASKYVSIVALEHLGHRINWFISPYVARAAEMPPLREGLIAKGDL
jgi:hypothetical protein